MTSHKKTPAEIIHKLTTGEYRYNSKQYNTYTDDLIYLLEEEDHPEFYLRQLLDTNKYRLDCLHAVSYMINECIKIPSQILCQIMREIIFRQDLRCTILIASNFCDKAMSIEDAKLFISLLMHDNLFIRLKFASQLKIIHNNFIMTLIEIAPEYYKALNLLLNPILNKNELKEILRSDTDDINKLFVIGSCEKFNLLNQEDVYELLSDLENSHLFEYFHYHSKWFSR